ncbi:MAG: metallophosphoesterase [Promethearchaeota archaeon]
MPLLQKNNKELKIAVIYVIFIVISIHFAQSNNNYYDQNKHSKFFYEKSDIDIQTQGSLDSAGYNIFWFIHISDTQFIWYNDDKIAQFNQLLNESYKTINPSFIYNTGDIVNSDYEHFITANERDQRIEEWERYRECLDKNQMNSTIYMDIMGNHDCYGHPGYSYFLKYSMMGKTFDTLQYSFKRKFSFGKYAFIGIHTPENYGAKYPHALFGYLSKEELDWYENELRNAQDCEKIFVFGHHPPYEIISEANSNGKTFFMLNDEYGVDYLFVGHGHHNTFQKINNLLAIETTNFDRDGGSYRIVAIDNNQLSTSLEFVAKWPQGIITYPPQNLYLTKNLKDDDLKKIRALAWDPKGIKKVEWAAFDESGNEQITDWKVMTNIMNTSLYEAKFDLDYDSNLKYLIKVKIEGGSGENVKEIIFSPKISFFFGWQIGAPLITISFFALISLASFITYYRRWKYPELRKTPEKKVDKKLKNLFILKGLIFLLVPLTFGGIYKGQITAVFSLLFVNSNGFYLNDVNLLFTGVSFMFCFFWIGFRLSYKHRNRLLAHLCVSIAFTIFLIIFYILHYPEISWFSPGYYAMLIIDMLMLKRNFQRKKEFRENIIAK